MRAPFWTCRSKAHRTVPARHTYPAIVELVAKRKARLRAPTVALIGEWQPAPWGKRE